MLYIQNNCKGIESNENEKISWWTYCVVVFHSLFFPQNSAKIIKLLQVKVAIKILAKGVFKILFFTNYLHIFPRFLPNISPNDLHSIYLGQNVCITITDNENVLKNRRQNNFINDVTLTFRRRNNVHTTSF